MFSINKIFATVFWMSALFHGSFTITGLFSQHVSPAQIQEAAIFRYAFIQQELPPQVYWQTAVLVEHAKRHLSLNMHIAIRRSISTDPIYANHKEVFICPYYWQRFSPDLQRYFIYHELSHVLLKHSQRRTQFWQYLNNMVGVDPRDKEKYDLAFARSLEREAEYCALQALAQNNQIEPIYAYIQYLAELVQDISRGFLPASLRHPYPTEVLDLCYYVLRQYRIIS